MSNEFSQLLYESQKPPLIIRYFCLVVALLLLGQLAHNLSEDYELPQLVGAEFNWLPHGFLTCLIFLPIIVLLLVPLLYRKRIFFDAHTQELILKETLFWERQKARVLASEVKEIQVCLKQPGRQFLWLIEALQQNGKKVLLAYVRERATAEFVASNIVTSIHKPLTITADQRLLDAGINPAR